MELLQPQHHDEISALIKNMQSPISEYSFANLYLFRRQHEYQILKKGEFTFIAGVTYDGTRYLMPFNPIATIDKVMLKELMSEGYCLFPIAEEDLLHFPESVYKYEYNNDDSDYIYTRTKIAEYPGRNLHKKRNLVKQYNTLYTIEDKPYSCDRAVDAKVALQRWFDIGGLPVEDTDYIACVEAIDHCEAFGLSGQVYYADGEPSGFLLGEELNDHTFVIHFAKGVTTFKGIYAHMYNSLAKSLPDRYTLLNFEQDLGKETLRQAKSTYLTDEMRKKYRVYLV